MEPRLRLESKTPHHTLFLHVWCAENDPLPDLRAELAKIGWKEDDWPILLPYKGEVERYFGIAGTGLFHGWTDDERRKYTRQVRNALRKLGYSQVPHYKLTFADCV